MSILPYLAGYPTELVERAEDLVRSGEALAYVAEHYPQSHDVRTSKALTRYVQDLKAKHMRRSAPLGKVFFDDRLKAAEDALGLHVTTTHSHGAHLRKRREIRVASVFKDAPAAFLRMIVVHELAHMKHADHDKDFYRLCFHMEPEYDQLEFDLRLYLSALEYDA